MEIVRASGCGRVEKEDLIDGENLGQVKSSRGKSISVKIVDLERLVQHAKDRGKDPVFFLGYERPGPVMMPRKWALVPLEKWKKRMR